MSVRRISAETAAGIRASGQLWRRHEITAVQYRADVEELLSADHTHERIYGRADGSSG